MIITLFFVVLLALLLGVYVLRPLLWGEKQTLSVETFESESDLRRLLTFRDQLLDHLLERPNKTPEKVASLSMDEAKRALVRVCEILKHSGLPHLPLDLPASQPIANESPSKKESKSGSNSPSQLCWALAALFAGMLAGDETAAQAQPLSEPGSGGSNMPPLVKQEDGTSLAQIHQFILSPDQGVLRVFYLSLFHTAAPEPVKLRIPSPEGAKEFDFSSMTQATVAPNRPDEPPVLEFTTEAGVNQVRGVFAIPAFTGKAHWRSDFFKTLSGVVLFILPQYDGMLTEIFGQGISELNLWPPRIVEEPVGFEFKRTAEQPNKRDPNFSRMKNPPQQYSFHYFRRGGADAPYPELRVAGLAPDRLPGMLLVVTFGAILAGVALFMGFRGNRNNS